MGYIHFQFQEEKLVQALAFLSLRGVADLTKLKAAKLLYLADRLHLNRYGRPITGDSYVCMDKGPVPSISLNEMNEAIEPEESTEQPAILRVLEVSRDSRYPIFALRDARLFDPDTFSRSELEVLGEVADSYGHMSAGELIEMTHHDHAWTKANERRQPGSSVPMPFETLFDDSNREMLELTMHDQEEEAEWANLRACTI